MRTTTTPLKIHTPKSAMWHYTWEAIDLADKLPLGTISEDTHKMGMRECEPLLVCMDGLLKYAKSYPEDWGKLAEDGTLGEPWLDAVKGIRALLNGNGAVAMRRDISTDSKDNGVIESLYWEALKVAGFEDEA